MALKKPHSNLIKDTPPQLSLNYRIKTQWEGGLQIEIDNYNLQESNPIKSLVHHFWVRDRYTVTDIEFEKEPQTRE